MATCRWQPGFGTRWLVPEARRRWRSSRPRSTGASRRGPPIVPGRRNRTAHSRASSFSMRIAPPTSSGRKAEIEEALAKLAELRPPLRWLQIDGPSGAGKSSFARAGIVPAVRAGRLAGGPKNWTTAVTRPGHDPIVSLADALRPRARNDGRRPRSRRARARGPERPRGTRSRSRSSRGSCRRSRAPLGAARSRGCGGRLRARRAPEPNRGARARHVRPRGEPAR